MVWSTQVNHRKRRELEQAEDAVTLEPKGKGVSTGAHALPVADGTPRRRDET